MAMVAAEEMPANIRRIIPARKNGGKLCLGID
jgi:hypothetical protein